jgi:hypothetical protein
MRPAPDLADRNLTLDTAPYRARSETALLKTGEQFRLVIERAEGETFLELGVDLVTMGREPSNTVIIDDSLTSRRHAEMSLVEDHYQLRDLGSRNGVRVNGQKVVIHDLAPGDIIQVGACRMRFGVMVVPPTPEALAEGKLKRLVVIAESIANASHGLNVLNGVTEQLLDLVDAEDAILVLIEERTRNALMQVRRCRAGEKRVDLDPIVFDAGVSAEETERVVGRESGLGNTHLLIAPIRSLDRHHGFFLLQRPAVEEPFTEEHADALRIVAGLTAAFLIGRA